MRVQLSILSTSWHLYVVRIEIFTVASSINHRSPGMWCWCKFGFSASGLFNSLSTFISVPVLFVRAPSSRTMDGITYTRTPVHTHSHRYAIIVLWAFAYSIFGFNFCSCHCFHLNSEFRRAFWSSLGPTDVCLIFADGLVIVLSQSGETLISNNNSNSEKNWSASEPPFSATAFLIGKICSNFTYSLYGTPWTVDWPPEFGGYIFLCVAVQRCSYWFAKVCTFNDFRHYRNGIYPRHGAIRIEEFYE